MNSQAGIKGDVKDILESRLNHYCLSEQILGFVTQDIVNYVRDEGYVKLSDVGIDKDVIREIESRFPVSLADAMVRNKNKILKVKGGKQ